MRLLRGRRGVFDLLGAALVSGGMCGLLGPAVFAFWDLVLNPFPAPIARTSRLYDVSFRMPRDLERPVPIPYKVFRLWADNPAILLDSAAAISQPLESADNAVLAAEFVTDSFFRLLGLQPQCGSLFRAADSSQGLAAVISDRFARQQFGSAAAALGKSLRLRPLPVTVVGVLSPDVGGWKRNADLWLPIELLPQFTPLPILSDAGFYSAQVIVTMRPDATATQTAERLTAAVDQLPGEDRQYPPPVVRLRRLRETVVPAATRKTVSVLLAAGSLTLILTICAAGGLWLAHVMSARGDIAVRRVLGAEARHVLLTLAPTVLIVGAITAIAAVGASAGVAYLLRANAIAYAGSLARSLAPAGLAIAGTLLSCAPAVAYATRLSVAGALRDLAPSSRLVLGGRGIQTGLVAFQVGGSLALASVAFLLVRSWLALSSTPIGATLDGGVVLALDLNRYRADGATAQVLNQIEERLVGLTTPSVGLSQDLPLTSPRSYGSLWFPDRRPVLSGGATKPPGLHAVNTQFFRALGIRLVKGRVFQGADDWAASRVVVVSSLAAQEYWPDEEPIGKLVRTRPDGPWATVVGVVDDVRYGSLATPLSPDVYVPLAQHSVLKVYAFVRPRAASGHPDVRSSLRSAVVEITREEPRKVIDASGLLDQELRLPRFLTVFAGMLAAMLVVTTAVTTYSFAVQLVVARRFDVGVRLALGAPRWLAIKAMCADVFRGIHAGLVLGGLLYVLAAGLLRAALHGVSWLDPTALLGGWVALTATTYAATVAAAWRGTGEADLPALLRSP